jgi:hypothetical protein
MQFVEKFYTLAQQDLHKPNLGLNWYFASVILNYSGAHLPITKVQQGISGLKPNQHQMVIIVQAPPGIAP